MTFTRVTALSLALFFVGVCAFLGSRLQDYDAPTPREWSESRDLLNTLLRERHRPFTAKCHRDDPAERSGFGALRGGAAAVTCRLPASDPGPVTITRTRTRQGVDDFFDLWQGYYGNVYGTCIEGQGRTTWSDASGRTRGQLLCAYKGAQQDYDRDVARLIWTDTTTQTGYVVSSGTTGLGGLLEWWRTNFRDAPQISGDEQKAVKLRRRGLAALKRTVGSALDITASHCKSQTLEPSAIIGLTCQPLVKTDGTVLSQAPLTVHRFATAAVATAAMDRYEEQYANSLTDAEPRAKCRSFPAARHSWEDGELLCFPAGQRQWLGWTDTSERTFSLVGEAQASPSRMMKLWEDLP